MIDSVWIETESGKIFGVLISPSNLETSKVPAVLLLQGGGNVGLSNYLYEAKFFAENGMIALVCDKAGVGLSEGEISWEQQTFDEKVQEYLQLFKYLKNLPNVDHSKMGVHGMSEGGKLAIMLAYELKSEVSFVNTVSGSLESFKENQLYAIMHHLYTRNIESSIIAKTIAVWEEYFEGISERNIKESTISKANDLRSKYPELRFLPGNTTQLPLRPHSEDIHNSVQHFVNEIEANILFQFGANDIRVNTSKSVSLLENKKNFTIKVYDCTDHNMTLPNQNANPDYMRDKEEWLAKIIDYKQQ